MKTGQFMQKTNGFLYIVATPIGNLEDITTRAINVLSSVDLIAAEDTRHSGLLLTHLGIRKPLFALHDHNERQKMELLLTRLQQGENIALISDAGTPLISDPGFHLVRHCRQAGINIIPIPGACAMTTALCATGIASDRFCFEGFLPAKPKARRDKLTALCEEARTLIFYESTHRIIDSLADIVAIFGAERYVVLARELTKTWETIYGDKAHALLDWVNEDSNRTKGEMVLVIEGKSAVTEENIPTDAVKALALLAEELPLKKAASITAEIFGLKKNELYQYGIEHFKNK